jgi:prepilin-type N-terminal cleavage/methylation domain-containing protein
MNRRRAFTLIEVTVVLTVLSIVWLSVTTVLYTLYRADHRLRDDLQREQAIDRVSMRLRLDTHEANSARIVLTDDGTNELVLLVADDKSIHYGMEEAHLYRIVREGDAVLHRDRFLVGRATSEWTLHHGEEASLVVLTLTAVDKRTEATRVWQIKAAVQSTTAANGETSEATP